MKQESPARLPIVRIQTVTAGFPRVGYNVSINRLIWESTKGRLNFEIIPPTLSKASDIPLNRNRCIEDDLVAEKEWDYWMWIDDDHQFFPQDAAFLVEAAESNKQIDMVGALVSMPSEKNHFAPVVYDGYDDAIGGWKIWMTGWEKPGLYGPPKHKLWYGTAFCLIRRRVFEKIRNPWYERETNKARKHRWVGNDLSFCDKMHDLGLQIWLDSRPNVGHYREEYVYTRSHFLESGHQAEALKELRAQHPLEPSEKEDINTKEHWDAIWADEKNRIWAENRIDAWMRIHPRIRDNSRVLHYGSGGGWFAERIKEEIPGAEVTGVEISSAAAELAKARGINTEVSGLKSWSYNGYKDAFDCILITDWIERLPDPQDVVNRLVRVLKPNGKIILMGANMIAGPEEVPEHHHMLSKFSLGYLLDKAGGRVLDIEEFTERLVDEGGKQFADIPRVVVQAVFKEKK